MRLATFREADILFQFKQQSPLLELLGRRAFLEGLRICSSILALLVKVDVLFGRLVERPTGAVASVKVDKLTR